MQTPILWGGVRRILIGAEVQDVEKEEQVAECEEVKDGGEVNQRRDVSCIILCRKKKKKKKRLY